MAQLKSPCSELSVAFTSSVGYGKRGGTEEGVRDEFVETDSRTVTPKRGHNTLKTLLEMFSLSNFQTKHRPNLLNWRTGLCFYSLFCCRCNIWPRTRPDMHLPVIITYVNDAVGWSETSLGLFFVEQKGIYLNIRMGRLLDLSRSLSCSLLLLHSQLFSQSPLLSAVKVGFRWDIFSRKPTHLGVKASRDGRLHPHCPFLKTQHQPLVNHQKCRKNSPLLF